MDKATMGVSIRHLNLFRARLDAVSREAQFKKIATMFLGASYKMGSENFNECDCSGLICSSLSGMGYSIRVNANDIINTCATEITDQVSEKVVLVGFYDKKAGKYTHIGIKFDSPSAPTILHSSYPTGVAFENSDDCKNRYKMKGYLIKEFALDFNKVEQMDGKVYGLDEDFK